MSYNLDLDVVTMKLLVVLSKTITFFASTFNLLQHSGYESHRLLDTAVMPNIAVVTSL
jgi:hypothetical protein